MTARNDNMVKGVLGTTLTAFITVCVCVWAAVKVAWLLISLGHK